MLHVLSLLLFAGHSEESAGHCRYVLELLHSTMEDLPQCNPLFALM
jgi:hypothetical protein